MEKAGQEYRRYQVKSLSPVEQSYLEYMKELADAVKKSQGSK